MVKGDVMVEAVESEQKAETPYPNSKYAWYVTTLLLLAYILSFVDRQIMSLLIEPIKADFGLTDFRIGLLMGPAFAFFYVSLGIPIGWLADRKSRRTIVGVGITVWCFMTAACGLSRNFGQLFVARIGVGAGEAVLTPSALSLIADYFPQKQRARAVSLYMTGISLGGGVAYFVGGPLIAVLLTMPPFMFPIYGELAAWQTAFLIVGLPGLILALLMFTVKEPIRRGLLAVKKGAGNSSNELPFKDSMIFLFQRKKAYLSLFFGMSVVTLVGYTGFWNAALFERTWDWNIGTIGVTLGLAALIFGPLGANGGGWIADFFTNKGIKDGPMRAMYYGVILTVVTNILYPLMPSGNIAMVFYIPSILGGAMASACGAAACVHIAPNQVRAQATAIYWLIINMVGLMLGPPSIGIITDLLGDPSYLKYSMALVPFIAGVPAILLIAWGLKHYKAAAEEAEAWAEKA
jgi:MFS family permease|tara:strand:+ start:2925 stop:4310 length:1386 start_codon:yes stop_codon:yes gene_type:complete